jgi:O-antigen ligase
MVFLRWSQYIPVFFLVLNMDLRSEQIGTFVKTCVVAGVLMAGVTIVEALFIGVDYAQIRGPGLVTRGLFIADQVANYNISAAYMAVVALLIAPFMLATKQNRKWRVALILVFLLAGLWLTTSRSALFALVIGFAFVGMLYFPRLFIRSAIVLVPLGTAGLWLLRDTRSVQNWMKLRYIPQALPMLLGASFESTGLPPYAGGGVARLSLWGKTIRFFAQSPFWGRGFRATRWSMGPSAYFTADNYFLEILADTGLIGLILALLFLSTLYVSAIRLHKLARKKAFLQAFSIGYLMAFVGLVVINLFGGMFMSQKIWGTFIILSAVLCNQLHVEQKQRLAV